MPAKKIIVSAGGTGGHIIPALSLCKELIRKETAVYYIGNKDSMEFEIISKNDIPFYPINVQKIYRSFTIKHFLFPFKLIYSIFRCTKYFKMIRPDAFVGFGGFVAGAPAVAAWLCHCPIYLQEQNCKPGLTNIWTGKFAKAVFLAYEDSMQYFGKANCFVTGNPILGDGFLNASSDKSLNESSSSSSYTPDSKKLLILGGSQGSLFINNLILENLDWFRENTIALIWQTGKRHLENIKSQIPNYEDRESSKAIILFDFTDNIHEYYRQADYIISRGGALSLAEIEIHKIPAFVIPLSTAAVNEQYHNARYMQNRNMGMMFEEKDRDLFIEKFNEFIKRAKDMYQEENETLHLTAAENIADMLLKDSLNTPSQMESK